MLKDVTPMSDGSYTIGKVQYFSTKFDYTEYRVSLF